jgi:hypothetical protein
MLNVEDDHFLILKFLFKFLNVEDVLLTCKFWIFFLRFETVGKVRCIQQSSLIASDVKRMDAGFEGPSLEISGAILRVGCFIFMVRT